MRWVVVVVAGTAVVTAAYLSLARRRTEAIRETEPADVSGLVLAVAFAAGLAVSVADGPLGSSRAFGPVLFALGLVLFVAGVTVRVLARRALARHFSARLRTTDDHELITAGPYRLVRHPAYTGSLVLSVGLAAMLGSPAGAAVMFVGCALALAFRIHREELLLRRRFGPAFDAYARRTRRLIPGLY